MSYSTVEASKPWFISKISNKEYGEIKKKIIAKDKKDISHNERKILLSRGYGKKVDGIDVGIPRYNHFAYQEKNKCTIKLGKVFDSINAEIMFKDGVCTSVIFAIRGDDRKIYEYHVGTIDGVCTTCVVSVGHVYRNGKKVKRFSEFTYYKIDNPSEMDLLFRAFDKIYELWWLGFVETKNMVNEPDSFTKDPESNSKIRDLFSMKYDQFIDKFGIEPDSYHKRPKVCECSSLKEFYEHRKKYREYESHIIDPNLIYIDI